MIDTKNSGNGAAVVLCRLSIERCQIYLAHLCACLHLAAHGEGAWGDIAAGLERELKLSCRLLDQYDR